MTQDERWQTQYRRLAEFMEKNRRRPSKYRPEEREMHNWYKYVKKAIAKGGYPPRRVETFALLEKLAAQCRRKNQYK